MNLLFIKFTNIKIFIFYYIILYIITFITLCITMIYDI